MHREASGNVKANACIRVTTELYQHGLLFLSVSCLVSSGKPCSKTFQHMLVNVGLIQAEL